MNKLTREIVKYEDFGRRMIAGAEAMKTCSKECQKANTGYCTPCSCLAHNEILASNNLEFKIDLKLTLKKEWFDKILAGEKKEEYREINSYWKPRLSKLIRLDSQLPIIEHVHFFNGGYFSEKLPNFKIEFLGAEIGGGKTEWGAEPGKKYYVIKLGNIIN